MIKMVGQFKLIKFDRLSYLKDLSAAFDAMVREGAKAFVLEVFGKIPVYTGQAAASLRPLASELGISLPIAPAVNGRYNKNMQTGEAAGGFEFSKGPVVYSVTLSSEVFYLWLNSRYDMSRSMPHLKTKTPWEAEKAGQQAFREYIADQYKRAVTDMIDYVEYTDVKV